MKCVMTVDIRRPFSEVNECMMDGDVGEYVHSSVAVPLFDAVDDFIFRIDAGLPTDGRRVQDDGGYAECKK